MQLVRLCFVRCPIPTQQTAAGHKQMRYRLTAVIVPVHVRLCAYRLNTYGVFIVFAYVEWNTMCLHCAYGCICVCVCECACAANNIGNTHIVQRPMERIQWRTAFCAARNQACSAIVHTLAMKLWWIAAVETTDYIPDFAVRLLRTVNTIAVKILDRNFFFL